jgi:hypothetical protein
MRIAFFATLAGLAAGALAPPARAGELADPVLVRVGGRPIDGEIGHLAPWLHDLDGDGRRDLLVGQFGGGRLKIYMNVGTDEAPRFETAVDFMAGGEQGVVPAG